MKRRHFLTISAIASTVARVSAAEPQERWGELVEKVLKFTAKSEDGELSLDVELIVPPDDEVEEINDAEGNWEAYSWRGKILPEGFWRSRSLIKKFDFVWDGKAIPIEERFWNDIAGFEINTILKKPALLPTQKSEYETFLSQLRQPLVILSADLGTALIEWERGDECDSSSTYRWIISKSGTVLRHRHTPPHEC